MFDISLERFDDEFGFLTFLIRSNATPRPNFTATSKGVVLNQWGLRLTPPPLYQSNTVPLSVSRVNVLKRLWMNFHETV